MKHRVHLEASLIRAAEWRRSYIYPTFFAVEEVEEWVAANVRGRCKIIAERTGKWTFQGNNLNIQENFRPVVAFGRKDDAAIFKLRWC